MGVHSLKHSMFAGRGFKVVSLFNSCKVIKMISVITVSETVSKTKLLQYNLTCYVCIIISLYLLVPIAMETNDTDRDNYRTMDVVYHYGCH